MQQRVPALTLYGLVEGPTIGRRQAESGDIDGVVPFASLFLPLVEAARAVPRSPVLAGSARADLARALLLRLSAVGSNAARAELGEPGSATSVRRYRLLVAAGPGALDDSFPLLGPLLAMVVGQWEEATAQLVERLEADRGALARLLGEQVDLVITSVSPPLGDPHHGGRQVMALTTARGGSVVAKPRPIDGEAALAEVARRLAATGTRWPGLDTTATVVRDGYGWSRRVRPKSTTDARRWWERAGAALAVAHATGATDLHHENVVAGADGPVLVDLECLAHGDLIVADDTPAQPLWVSRDSVTATGLLPGTYRSGGPRAVDLAGFGTGAARADGSFGPAWIHLGTDAIRQERRPAYVAESDNRGRSPDGVRLAPDIDALGRGLDRTLTAVDAHPEVLEPVGAIDAPRLILRATADYETALQAMVSPEALSGTKGCDAAVASLPSWSDREAGALGVAADRVDAAEQAALARLDVPVHRSSGADIVLDGGEVAIGVLARSSAVRLAGRRRQLDGPYRRAQVEITRLQVEQSDPAERPVVADLPRRRRSTAPDPDPRRVAVDAAWQLWGERLEVAEQGDGPGEQAADIRWLEVGYVPTLARVSPRTFPTRIWDGRDGVGLALTAAAVRAPEIGHPRAADLRDVALSVMRAEPEPRRAPGAGPAPRVPWVDSGSAGQALARVWAGDLLAAPDLVATGAAALLQTLGFEAEDDLARVEARAIPVDLVGGWAGVVAAVAGTLDRLPEPDRVVVAEALSARTEWLVEVCHRQLDATGATPVGGARTLHRLGLAHGLTGVLLALARAAMIGGRGAGEAARRLAAVEAERVAARDGIGGRISGHGSQRHPEATWCWGTSGYLLAHLDPAVATLAPANPDWLRRSVDVVVEQGPEQVAHLCCGRAGHLAALNTAERAGLEPSTGPSVAEARARLVGELARGLAEGSLRFDPRVSFPSPGLFTGRAGVVWSLLADGVGERLPSLLTFGP